MDSFGSHYIMVYLFHHDFAFTIHERVFSSIPHYVVRSLPHDISSLHDGIHDMVIFLTPRSSSLLDLSHSYRDVVLVVIIFPHDGLPPPHPSWFKYYYSLHNMFVSFLPRDKRVLLHYVCSLFCLIIVPILWSFHIGIHHCLMTLQMTLLHDLDIA